MSRFDAPFFVFYEKVFAMVVSYVRISEEQAAKMVDVGSSA